MLRKGILITLALLIVATLSFFGYKIFVTKKETSQQVNSQQRQAVFMTNGQVYFGFLSDIDKPLVSLKDVYYLKTDDLNPNVQKKKTLLIKLGDELHSPEDEMSINRDQILFYQDIRNDSKINEAIERYINKGGQPEIQTPTSP